MLGEPGLTLRKAEEIVLTMELASNHVANTQSTEPTPIKVYDVYSAARIKIKNPASYSGCHRCGDKHEALTCQLKVFQCLTVENEVYSVW